MVQCIFANHGNNGDYNQHYLRPSTIAFMAFKVKRYYKSRITYYNNAVASFNFLELHTQLSGDIHPQPGPDSQLSIPVRITQSSH